MSSSDTDHLSYQSSTGDFSPPTSPFNQDVSPPTSPAKNSLRSPPTSPLTLKRKRRNRKNAPHRSTVLRRQFAQGETEYDALEIEESSQQDTGGETAGEEDSGLHRPHYDVECSLSIPSEPSQASDGSSSCGDSSDYSDASSSNNEDVNGILEQSMSDSSDTAVENNSDNNSSDSEEGACCLYDGSEMSVNEALLAVLKLYTEEKWTKTSLDKCVKLIRKLLPQPNEFPISGKSVFKKLEDLTCSYSEEVYFLCGKCSKLLPNNAVDCCDDCDEIVKFYSCPIKEQIKHFFEQRNLASIIDYHHDHHHRREGYICDIQDGSIYKNIRETLTGQYDLVLLWNTDGVALSGSSNRELWPILATICEIPLRLRPSFMLICGVFVGSHKPNMNEYLKPFVNSMKDIYMNGVTWKHPVSKQSFTSHVAAPALSADAPAKAEVLFHMNHNSRYGCNTCEQKTKKIDLTAQEILENEAQVNPRKRKKRNRRFVFQDDIEPAELRSGERMELQGALAEARGKSRKGILGEATVSQIPLFDRATCVCAEYLHLILLGVVKYFVLKIFLEKDGDWYLGNHISDIDDLICQIKVPDFVKRLPRGMKDVKYWKGSEFRNFILYYSLPIFSGCMPDKYFQHWLLLVGAVYILLKEQISENDLQSAEIMLRGFVRDVGKLYGDNCYTYNVHTLNHVCLLVRRWGTLYATSGFSFESFNGFISAHIHGTKNFAKELTNNIKIFQSVAVLENSISGGPQDFPRLPTSACNQLLGRAWSKSALSEAEKLAISDLLPGKEDYMVHHRAKVMSTIYTCHLYDQGKKRVNSYVQLTPSDDQSTSRFGQITAFIKFDDNSVFCCLKDFKINHVNLFVHEDSRFVIKNLIPFEVGNSFSVIPVKNLITKLCKIKSYLAIRPNSYEINL